MIPAIANLTDKRGDTWRVTITLDDGETPATPTNLTGCTARAQVRKSPGASPAIDFVVANSPLGVDGVIELVAADSTTAPSWTSGDRAVMGVWDCEVTNAAGETDTVAGGTFRILPDVTRSAS